MREISTGARGFKNLPVFASSAIIAIICLFFSVSSASAQRGGATSSSSHESDRAAQVRELNNSVLQLHGQMQENASGAAGVRGQAAIVLAQRATKLAALIQENPRAALSFAFSPNLLADLAAKFPGSSSQLESHVTLSGPVEHWITDSADMKSSEDSWFLNAGASRLTLHFSTTQRPDPKASPVVTIEGVQVGSDVAVSKVSSAPIGGAGLFPQITNITSPRSFPLALLVVIGVFAISLRLAARKVRLPTSGSRVIGILRQLAVCAVALLVVVSSPLSASAQGTCSTTGVQNIAVLMVQFPGRSLSATPQSIHDLFFGTADP